MIERTLEGRSALVTGAGRGYGRTIALRLAAAGANVALLARNADQLKAVASEVADLGARAVCVAADVTDPAAVVRAVGETAEALGGPDILVSNAGVPGPFGPIWQADPSAWWAAQEVHLRAPATLLHAVLPAMVERGQGCCVLISALASRVTIPFMSAYSTGKAAQNKLVECIAAEVAAHGIGIFAVDPGFTVTQLARDSYADPAVRTWLPFMIEHLERGMEAENGDVDLHRTAERVAALATGRFHALSGRYLTLDDDLDELMS